jgi:glucose PTS system EIICB or EIICBA component
MISFKSAFSLLQKIGKCMMLPVSVLPIAGILLGVEYVADHGQIGQGHF